MEAEGEQVPRTCDWTEPGELQAASTGGDRGQGVLRRAAGRSSNLTSRGRTQHQDESVVRELEAHPLKVAASVPHPPVPLRVKDPSVWSPWGPGHKPRTGAPLT